MLGQCVALWLLDCADSRQTQGDGGVDKAKQSSETHLMLWCCWTGIRSDMVPFQDPIQSSASVRDEREFGSGQEVRFKFSKTVAAVAACTCFICKAEFE